MDGVFEKLGLYDFFGVFLSGVVAIIIGSTLNLPITPLWKDFGSEIINGILFLSVCFFTGIILQEVGSFLDKKFLKLQKNAKSKFLNSNSKIVENEFEQRSFRKIANEILQKPNTNNTYTPQENERVFYHCKTYLEAKGQINKANKINSLYGMSRSLLAASFFFLVKCFLYALSSNAFVKFFPTMVILAILIVLFYKRAKRFSEYRVRVVLRLYEIAQMYP